MGKGTKQSPGHGAAAKTSKKRVKAAVTKGEAMAALAAMKTSGGGLEPVDADGLSPRHRAVLRARGIERQSYQAMAEALGVSISTIARVLKEALEKLDAHIQETAGRVKAMDLAKLDEIEAIHTPKMLAGEKVSADLILRVIARRGKILGYTQEDMNPLGEGEIDRPTWIPLDPDESKGDDSELDAELANAMEPGNAS